MNRVIRIIAAGIALTVCAFGQSAEKRLPGLLLSVFEVNGELASIPDIPPTVIPNVVKPITNIDLDIEKNDFGVQQDFVSQISGLLTIKEPGNLAFRLTSDDGSRLILDGRVIIDHDGQHSAEPKDGAVDLSAGEHTLLLQHFQGAGGGSVKLAWKPAGAKEFAPIPPDLLSHDAASPISTVPGKKQVIAALRRGKPGDGTPVAGMDPAYTSGPAPERPRNLKIGLDDTPWAGLAAISRPLDGLKGPYLFLPGGEGAAMGHASRRTIADGETAVIVANGTHSLWRANMERVGDTVQGAVFRFADHLPDNLVRVAVGPDNSIYAWNNEAVFGAEGMPPFLKITPSKVIPFEMNSVHVMSNGLEIEFSAPLLANIGWDPESYYLEQWPYSFEKHQAPVRDGIVTPVQSASVSTDRRKVFLEVAGLKPNHVIYLRLLPPSVSESGDLPWSTEAWYTLRELPKAREGKVLVRPPLPPRNQLSDAEKKDGWKLLFDGQTINGWHNFKKKGPVEGWKAIDGALVRFGQGGDLVTDESFDNFELKLEWRISPAGNSGVMFRVSEDEDYPWRTGAEMQVLDNAEHPDGRNPKTSAGSNYALIAPPRDVTKPIGLFNEARIICNGAHVEYWLNGLKTAVYEINSPEWKAMVAASKFKDMPRYGQNKTGVIALQDHGDRVWYRNVKIRKLSAPSTDRN